MSDNTLVQLILAQEPELRPPREALPRNPGATDYLIDALAALATVIIIALGAAAYLAVSCRCAVSVLYDRIRR
jgi:hypothetical protein